MREMSTENVQAPISQRFKDLRHFSLLGRKWPNHVTSTFIYLLF